MHYIVLNIINFTLCYLNHILSLSLPVCVCMHAHMSVQVHMHVCTYVEARDHPQVSFLRHCPVCILRQGVTQHSD